MTRIEEYLKGILDNCARMSLQNPEVAAAIFVDCYKSNNAVIPGDRIEEIYQESLREARENAGLPA